MNMLAQWNGITDNIIVHLLTSLIYIIGANFVFDMQLSVGSVFAFITYSAYVTGPISAILNIGYLLSGIIPSTKRYYEFMALEEEKENEEGMTEPCFGDLELQNLSFSYEKDKAVLSDINIAFPKGSKTVLIGRNGSGKSTLISLLLQLYQPTGGKITLNGIDISEFVLREYRNMISVVSQEIYLFNSSIRDNICMYKNIDDKTIMEACKDSGLADFISEVSLDYVVGQNGAMLSEGQKQKIALARALVHNSPVIIFDEATSNTDVYSRDLSNKVSSAMHTRILKGENISGQLRYGYVKDPNDKHKIIVDPEAAEVVKLIFELTAQGKSKTEVANYLNAQGIDTPSAYKKRKGSRNFFHAVEVKSLWSTSSIRDILNDEVYLGKLIWNKTKKRIGSNNTSSYVPKDEWMVIENCHEPIIAQELFDMAHANSKKCVRSKRGKRNYNPFYYCGVCGRALAPSKRVKGDILLCYSSRIEENSPCKSNRVEIAKVEDAIMKTVNMYATVYLDEKGIKRAGKSKEVSSEEKLAVLEKKVKSLSSKKMMLYSDYKDDKLTREEYVKRSKAMVEQIDELHQEIEQLKTEIPPEDNSSSKFETQLESIINMESFDREKIQKVIKKVIINGEDNIEIVWNTDDPFFK